MTVETESIEAHYSYKQTQSESTAKEYRRHITRFYRFLKAARYCDRYNFNNDVNLFNCHSGHVENYYGWMLNEENYSPSSVRVAHASLSDFYDQLDKFGSDGRRGFPQVTVEDDPTEYASPERLDGMHSSSKKKVEGGDVPLTPEEVSDLIDNVPAPTVRNKLIVRLLYQTGVRRGELVKIKLEHIDREDRSIQIYGEKTETSRTVWYQPTLDSILDLWIHGDREAVFYAEDSEYLLPTRRNEYMAAQTVTDVVQEAAENAGLQETVYRDKNGAKITRVGAHTLRKSFGVHFINNGGDISFLMELLGHANIETTKENYLVYSEKDLRQSVDHYGPST